jgi:hypothetical protein
MHWEQMTLDEYAEYEKGNGARLVQVDNIWWRAVRPFFYRPLFPFNKLSGNSIRPPGSSFIFGYQYPVANEKCANSYLNLLVFDDIHSYSIGALKHKQRNEIQRAMKTFSIKPLDDHDEFLQGGYKAYIDFYRRTHYQWKNERVRYASFVRWADHLFRHKKVVVHGVFSKNGDMVAVNISYFVEDVIIDAAFFSTTDALKMGSSDLTWHTIRECAADTKQARYIYEGTVTGEKGVDDSKIRRGCLVLAQPAYFYINPVFHLFCKNVSKGTYSKLLGMNNEQLANRFYNKRHGKRAI